MLTCPTWPLGNDFAATVLTYPANLPLDYAGLAERLYPLLPTEEPYILLGESFGGPLAVALAAKQPALLRGLVLCASFLRYPVSALCPLALLARYAPTHAAPTRTLAWFLLGKWSTAATRQSLAASLANVSAAALRKRMESVLRVDVTALLSRVTVPVLYLRASDDRVVPRSAGDAVLKACADAKLIELEGPHFLLQSAPVACARTLRRFAGFKET